MKKPRITDYNTGLSVDWDKFEHAESIYNTEKEIIYLLAVLGIILVGVLLVAWCTGIGF